jgi:hypothetical protein
MTIAANPLTAGPAGTCPGQLRGATIIASMHISSPSATLRTATQPAREAAVGGPGER